jgi:hypothetical protein
MPRFITVTVGCDWDDCTTQGVEGDGTVFERTIAVDSKPAKAFLLCEKHSQGLDDVVLPLMAKGIKVEQKSAVAAGTIECKECGRTDIKNKAGLAQHVIRSHEFENLAAYEAKYHVHIE